MNLNCKFNNLKPSNELTNYIEGKIERLQKYEMKPIDIIVTLKVERGVKKVDIHASGEKLVMHAQGLANNFFESIDLAMERLGKQLAKKKSKTQKHKCHERTHLGKIEMLSPSLMQKEAEEEFYDIDTEVA